jgi:hypothetical protein
VLNAAEKQLRSLHQATLKQLRDQYTKECTLIYTNLEAKASQEMKDPKHNGDREEMNR